VNYRGRAKGNTIELAESLPFPDGQSLRVEVEAWPVMARAGSAQAVRQAMGSLPHLATADVSVLESAIEHGEIPVAESWSFNENKG